MMGEARGTSSGDALAARLATLGLAGTIAVRGKLAVLTLRDASPLRDAALRAAAIAAAAEHGFTNLALELDDGGDRASLSRD